MIVIIDYGMGNLGSIKNMLKRLGIETIISEELDVISQARKLILPGVGAFDNGMKNLAERKMIALLNKRVVADRVPILGICLGMQLLTRKSEEGILPGLGWIDADTIRFRFDNGSGLKVPHMGWNVARRTRPSSLTDGIVEEQKYYFVHSYHVACVDKTDEILQTNFGFEFTSAVQKGNIFGVQFHPEKSHKFGMKILENFSRQC